MQHDGPLIRTDIHIVHVCVKLNIGEDERGLRRIVGLVDFVEDFCKLWETARPTIDEEHLPVGCLASLSVCWPRYVPSDVDFLGLFFFPCRSKLAGRARRFQCQLQLERDEHRQSFGPKNVDNVISGRGIAFRREEDDFLALVRLLRDGELHARQYTSVLVQNADDPVPLPFNVAFQLAASDGEVFEQPFYADGGAFLGSNHAGAFELARRLKLQP